MIVYNKPTTKQKSKNKGNNSCGYTRLLPEVTLWVIALGWDGFGFPVRFSPPVTLQIITQGQLLTWQYSEHIAYQRLLLDQQQPARHCSHYQNSSVKHLASLSFP